MRLLRIYPAAWRARYGDELAALIEALDGSARTSWWVCLDIARAGLVERTRTFGVCGLSPRERAREGTLLVLYSWMLFVIGGFGVQKASEHWQAVTPTARQEVPTAAFDTLFATAAVGSVLVMLGVAASLPRLVAAVRDGGWTTIRRPIIRAGSLSALMLVATVGLAAWARNLAPAARNGSDLAYGGAFVGWLLLFGVCLLAWAAAAGATARQLRLSDRVLRFEVRLGMAVSAAMAVMTLAAAVWWGSLARAAPWFFAGRPSGSAASAFQWNMIVPVAWMLGATAISILGASRAARAFS